MYEDYVVIRSFRRTLSLGFDREGKLVVKAPRLMPEGMIRAFVENHREWIGKHRPVAVQGKAKSIGDGDTVPFLGKKYSLHVGQYREIRIEDSKILFPKALEFRIEKELDQWIRKQAAEIITATVREYAEKMGVSYRGSIHFSDTVSKWGSCTHDNRLQFNWRLVMAPLLILRYVVIHELVHVTHKNHGKAFWTEVAKYNPSYRQQVKWLREHGRTLS